MSGLTRWLDSLDGPHAGQPIATAGASVKEASAAVIMLHGRGATAEGILDLARLLEAPGVAFLAPQAFSSTWYPYSFLEAREANEPGLSSAHSVVGRMLEKLDEAGIPPNGVVMLGFSQGACLATDYAALNPQRYGGIVGLSGGLIGDELAPESYQGTLEGMPVFLGCSDIDPHIPVERVRETSSILKDLGAEVTTSIYPGMGHTINPDEVEQARRIVRNLIPG